jgi:hypothetical protein
VHQRCELSSEQEIPLAALVGPNRIHLAILAGSSVG